jgi:hypothetical protein
MKNKITTYLKNLNIALFFKKWNGALFAPIFIVLFWFASVASSGATGAEYSMISFVSLIIAICKIFFAEFFASILLYINQPDYFKVIHEPESLTPEKNNKPWRDSAHQFYLAYLFAAALILAFS